MSGISITPATYQFTAKIRWHRPFVQCIVWNTSISYLDVIMDMDQIRTFVAVARGRSFSGAAATLHRSQPAISRRIELLEREFDIALFERLRGGSILTDAGAAFLPYAEIVLAAAADGAEALRAGRQGETGRIPLALVGTLANAALTNALRQFGKQYPKVRLELRTATSQEVSDLVQRGEATLGLRYSGGRHSGVVSQIIAEEKLVVVARPDHPLADGRRYQPGKLAGERWVAFPARNRRESFVQFLQRKFLAAGLEDAEIIPIDSLTAQKRLVEAGFGIALLAESGIQEELKQGTLKVLNVPALRAAIPIALVYRGNGYLSAAARSLLSIIEASWRQPPTGGGTPATRRPTATARR
jgi:DNA-binding transcriptional LysR family regulator